MTVDRQAGCITIILEEDDFKYLEWRKILAEIKKIPTADFDGVLKIWSIEDTPENMAMVKQVTEKFVKDKDQLEFFKRG